MALDFSVFTIFLRIEKLFIIVIHMKEVLIDWQIMQMHSRGEFLPANLTA